jgi:hypothetical protein
VPSKLTPAYSPFYKHGKPETQVVQNDIHNEIREKLERDSYSPWKDKIQNCK